MELTEKELQQLAQLKRWSKNKSRKIILFSLLSITGLIFAFFIVIFLLGGVELKELLWIFFFLAVMLLGCKAVFDLESHIKLLLRIIEKLQKNLG